MSPGPGGSTNRRSSRAGRVRGTTATRSTNRFSTWQSKIAIEASIGVATPFGTNSWTILVARIGVVLISRNIAGAPTVVALNDCECIGALAMIPAEACGHVFAVNYCIVSTKQEVSDQSSCIHGE